MSKQDVIKETGPKMESVIEDLKRKLGNVRTGRASVGLLDAVHVDYYGTMTPLNQMASVAVPEPQLITIQPWDQSQLGAVEKAIIAANLGLNPSNDGKMIRLQVPAMSGDQRQKLVTRIKKSSEDAKVACRNIRRDANKHIEQAEKNKEMTEDERDQGKEEVQKLLKTYEDKVTEMAGVAGSQ